MDLIGPITGIKRENRFVLTVVDGYSRFLATRPIPNHLFSREMGVPARIITDRGSEFVSTDTQAVLEKSLGVVMSFIPAGKHQQNLVEQAYRMLWMESGGKRGDLPI